MIEQVWRTVWAPGRVNLIGEHTDYQGGWCLPIAIDLGTTVKFRSTADGFSTITSNRFDGAVRVGTDASSHPPDAPNDGRGDLPNQPQWGSGVRALIAALRERGDNVASIEAEVRSNVPIGSGLSSSASFMVALAMAFTHNDETATTALSGVELALTAQRAEHINGVPCGIMDQMASVFGQAHHAVLIDCRSNETELVRVPDSLGVVVIHSGLPRALADSQYAQRRAACAAACERLGVQVLRDVQLNEVLEDPFARHVVTENARVHAFVAAMDADDHKALGAILNASHQSLADDFLVSTPELNTLCDILNASGAYGARLTGAGFGGCVVALAPKSEASAIAAESARRYRDITGLQPFPFTTQASAGAAFHTTLEHS